MADDLKAKRYDFGNAHCSDSRKARQLVYEYIRVAERGGSDVRLDLQVPFRPKAWPRSGIRSSYWHWKIIMGYAWKPGLDSHINLY